MQKSKSLDLNKTDMKKIGKGLLIAVGGAVLTYLTDTIPNINWGASAPMVVAISSVLINAVWKYLKDHSISL